MSRKESVREHGILGGENYETFSIALFLPSVFVRTVDVVSMSDFGDLDVAGKLALPSFLRFWT